MRVGAGGPDRQLSKTLHGLLSHFWGENNRPVVFGEVVVYGGQRNVRLRPARLAVIQTSTSDVPRKLTKARPFPIAGHPEQGASAAQFVAQQQALDNDSRAS